MDRELLTLKTSATAALTHPHVLQHRSACRSFMRFLTSLLSGNTFRQTQRARIEYVAPAPESRRARRSGLGATASSCAASYSVARLPCYRTHCLAFPDDCRAQVCPLLGRRLSPISYSATPCPSRMCRLHRTLCETRGIVMLSCSRCHNIYCILTAASVVYSGALYHFTFCGAACKCSSAALFATGRYHFS